MKIIYPLLF